MEPQAKPGDYIFGAHNGTRPEDTYIIGTKESLREAGVTGVELDEGEALVYTTLTSAQAGYQGKLWIANGELDTGELGKHVNTWNGDPLAERLKGLAFKHLQRPEVTYEKNGEEKRLDEKDKNVMLEYVGRR